MGIICQMAEKVLLEEKNYSNDSVVMMFATRLKKLRFEKDITQAEFAKVIGVAQQTVGSWEKGNSATNYDMLNKISDYFNVSADYLFGRKSANKISLSSEQRNLLNGFEGLNEESKRIILRMIGQLNFARASIPTTTLAM